MSIVEPTLKPVNADSAGAGVRGVRGVRLVLIGDLHHYHLFAPPWQLLGKRFLGQANLWWRRRKHFDHSLLPAMAPRIAALKPHWMLLSGDVTTTSLPQEFARVTSWLHCGPLAHLNKVAVPGNHDRYTYWSKRKQVVEHWLGEWLPAHFPGWTRLGKHWMLLSLDSAVPRFFSSRGLVSAQQLEEATELVDAMPADTGLVVMCHYPFAVPPGIHWRSSHQLAHRDRVEALVKHAAGRAAQVVYVHGHMHQPWVWRPELSDHAKVTVVNAGSPCCKGKDHPGGQGFWQIDLPQDPTQAIALVRHAPVMARKEWVWKRIEEDSHPLQPEHHRLG